MNENFYNFKDVRRRNKEDINYIKSGIPTFDNKVGGFQKGQVSIWSGLNASGKTNVLNQQCIEYFKQGYNTVMFSGEMPAWSIKNMLYQQYAGKERLTHLEEYDSWVLANDKEGVTIKNYIDDLFDDKLFIYKNDKGTAFATVLNSIEYMVQEKNIDVVILDNLMAIDISSMQGDRNDKQKIFISKLSEISKKLDIHIHVVMHPRKTTGFLRKEDIAGSADLSNTADNVFIVHRVNNDFKTRFKEMFNAKKEAIESLHDGVIEICKNRNDGVQDLFIPLHFHRESKTFSERPNERKYM